MTNIKRGNKWERTFRYYYHRIFPRKRTAYEVGLSVFLGVFIGILPTIGIAIPLTMLACHFFKVPKIPGVISSFVAVPFTLFPFFYPLGLTVGVFLLDPPETSFDFLEQFSKLRMDNIPEIMGPIFTEASQYLFAFLLGISIVALVFGLALGFSSSLLMKLKHQKK